MFIFPSEPHMSMNWIRASTPPPCARSVKVVDALRTFLVSHNAELAETVMHPWLASRSTMMGPQDSRGC